MESAEVRFEELDATSTTLIMRGLNRQTTREMLLTMLSFGQRGHFQGVGRGNPIQTFGSEKCHFGVKQCAENQLSDYNFAAC